MQVLLWSALFLFIVSSFSSRKYAYLIGSAGWAFFAAHWAIQPGYYIASNDVFNVLVTIAVAVFCSFVVYVMVTNKQEETLIITKAAAIGGLFYFSFAELASLNYLLRQAVTFQTVAILNLLGISAAQLDWNLVAVNGYTAEIILGCTGIESMALLLGVICCVPASIDKKVKAFLVSVPVVYLLNVVRNAFVLTASGYEWFGPPEYSFYIAHNVLAKFGSILALIVIAFFVFRILPELLDMVVNVVALFRGGTDAGERM